MEHILWRAGRNYKFSSDKLSNRNRISSQESIVVLTLFNGSAPMVGTKVSIRKTISCILWEYGFSRTEQHTQNVGQWDLTRMGTDELRLDIA
jgi:hypothetical protein